MFEIQAGVTRETKTVLQEFGIEENVNFTSEEELTAFQIFNYWEQKQIILLILSIDNIALRYLYIKYHI